VTELKPCPFCGKSDKLKFTPATHHVVYNWRYDAVMPYTPGHIVCSRCDVTMEGPWILSYTAVPALRDDVTMLKPRTIPEVMQESDGELIKLWNMRRKENDDEIYS